jgi:hypothetical protein
MRVLDKSIVLSVAAILVLMLAAAAVNIFITVRFRRSRAVVLFQLASLFCVFGLFGLLMDLAILELRLELFYRFAYRLILSLSLVTYAAAAMTHFIRSKLNPNVCEAVADLKSVFSTVDDVAIIADYAGRIVDVNHPEALKKLALEAVTLQDLMRALGIPATAQVPDKLSGRLPAETAKVQFEVMLGQHALWYALSFYPIIAHDEYLGHALILQDITSIKNLEAQLQRQNDELEAANRQLAQDAHMAGVLEAEKQRLQVLESVQEDLAQHIEHAITEVHTLRRVYDESGSFCREEAARLAEGLRRIHKDVRRSIGAISGRSV